MKRYWLYVLKLEQNKYYVGVTSIHVESRFIQHRRGFGGAAWTRKYKPIKIIQTKDLGMTTYALAQEFEDKAVGRYIKKHGVDNVRGGQVNRLIPYHILLGRVVDEDNYKAIKTVTIIMALFAASTAGVLITSLTD